MATRRGMKRVLLRRVLNTTALFGGTVSLVWLTGATSSSPLRCCCSVVALPCCSAPPTSVTAVASLAVTAAFFLGVCGEEYWGVHKLIPTVRFNCPLVQRNEPKVAQGDEHKVGNSKEQKVAGNLEQVQQMEQHMEKLVRGNVISSFFHDNPGILATQNRMALLLAVMASAMRGAKWENEEVFEASKAAVSTLRWGQVAGTASQQTVQQTVQQTAQHTSTPEQETSTPEQRMEKVARSDTISSFFRDNPGILSACSRMAVLLQIMSAVSQDSKWENVEVFAATFAALSAHAASRGASTPSPQPNRQIPGRAREIRVSVQPGVEWNDERPKVSRIAVLWRWLKFTAWKKPATPDVLV